MAQVRGGRGGRRRGRVECKWWDLQCSAPQTISTMHPSLAPPLLRRFRSPRLERVQREGLFKKVNERCKRQRACPYCGAYNGTVK